MKDTVRFASKLVRDSGLRNESNQAEVEKKKKEELISSDNTERHALMSQHINEQNGIRLSVNTGDEGVSSSVRIKSAGI